MYIGAAYYPELWEESEIEKDIERCGELGVNCLRIGEFAWSKMEPQEGVFDLAWLERIVDRLHRAGISVVLCTPTCTPPRWFLDRNPEVRQADPTGRRENVSSRCHTCKTSGVMRKKNREIVEVLARTFGKRQGVIGWQIDNELFNYRGGCYCGLCKAAFWRYLEGKYHTIDELNRRWGMSRWSLEYGSFEDIVPPEPNEWRHPSLRTAWRQFQCEQIYSYVAEQAEILHRYSDLPVGTDMMPNNVLSYYRIAESVDVMQFNHYDTAANLDVTAFNYDFLRPIKQRPFWVTETQVGWNGSEVAENGYRPEGNCYANTWLPIAMGGEMNLYWLFRTHPAGHELAHGALFSSCGRRYHMADEARQASEAIGKCREFLEGSRVTSEIAIHYSGIAEHNFLSAPLLKDFSYRREMIRSIYMAFPHYNTDVIDLPHGLDGYRVLISPFLSHIDAQTGERIRQFVRGGGVWIVGPMSDIMTDDTVKYTAAPFSFLEEFAGSMAEDEYPIDNDVFTAEWKDGTPLPISRCYDALKPMPGTVSLADYRQGMFAGASVITERRVGAGRVILLGSLVSHDALRRLVGMAPTADASPNVRLVRRTGAKNGMIALELEHKEGYVVLEREYRELISGRVLSGRVAVNPYEVLVLQEEAPNI